jgi:Bacterial PH domain
MLDVRKQAVTGVIPPELAEALIREVWPSVAAHPGAAKLGRQLTRTIIGAPLAWILLAPFYLGKVLPLGKLAVRYTLTNRRLMIRRGMRPQPSEEVPLASIDEVRVLKDSNSEFFRAATLEIISGGKTALRLPGVPEPESFRYAIVNATRAWVPGKADGVFVPAKAP